MKSLTANKEGADKNVSLGTFTGPRIEITGNRNVVIDGCDGIIDYNDETAVFKIGRMNVIIQGRDLKIKNLTENSALINGFVKSVEYKF